jgi:hypothetical protein
MVPIEVSEVGLTVPLMANDEVGPEAVRPINNRVWHLTEDARPLTLCGRVIEYGSRRRLWAEVAETDRCRLCLERLGL